MNDKGICCRTCKHDLTDCYDRVGNCDSHSKWEAIRVEGLMDIKAEDSSHNNGGATDYYDLPKDVRDCQSIIEWRKMNHAQGNIFKASFCFNTGRHEGTTYERELNKIIYYAEREKAILKSEKERA